MLIIVVVVFDWFSGFDIVVKIWHSLKSSWSPKSSLLFSLSRRRNRRSRRRRSHLLFYRRQRLNSTIHSRRLQYVVKISVAIVIANNLVYYINAHVVFFVDFVYFITVFGVIVSSQFVFYILRLPSKSTSLSSTYSLSLAKTFRRNLRLRCRRRNRRPVCGCYCQHVVNKLMFRVAFNAIVFLSSTAYKLSRRRQWCVYIGYHD
jgi:hypothetical protein